MMKLKNDTHLIAPRPPSVGYFEFVKLNKFGEPYGDIQKINTTTGLVLNCHTKCDPKNVSHLADLARETPDYPVDISAWDGPEGGRFMVWSARIYWRGPKIGGR